MWIAGFAWGLGTWGLGDIALGQPAPTEDGPPLAIPVDRPPPEPPEPPEPRAPRVRLGAQRPAALREYRASHLSVRSLSEAHVQTGWSYGYARTWGPYGPGFGFALIPRSTLVRTEIWGVFQGPERLDVPSTLGALGDTSGRAALERRIRSQRALSSTSYGLGVAGLAASIVGLIGLENARHAEQALLWSGVSAGGAGILAAGFIGGTIPAARASRLQYDPTATFDIEQLQRDVAAHNAELASELGLSPEAARHIESEPPRRR